MNVYKNLPFGYFVTFVARHDHRSQQYKLTFGRGKRNNF